MELPILVVLLVSFILRVDCHPKNSDVLPKDYYKRQILQPIPGYIPVYIKADGVPIVRTHSKEHSPSVTPEKATLSKEKNLQSEDDTSSKLNDKTDETRSESSAENPQKPVAVNVQEKKAPTEGLAKKEKPADNPPVKAVDLKP